MANNIFEPIRGYSFGQGENQSPDHHCRAESKTVFMAGICGDMSEFALLSGIKKTVPLSKSKSNSVNSKEMQLIQSHLIACIKFIGGRPPSQTEPKCAFLPNSYLLHATYQPLFLCGPTN